MPFTSAQAPLSTHTMISGTRPRFWARDPMMGMDGMDGMEVYNPDMEEGGGMPWWAIALIVLALGGLGAGGFILYKKKRARHLEDL